MKESYGDQTGASLSEAGGVEESDGDTERLSLDERFEILKNERRRLVLRLLRESGETMKLNNLADQVTAIENETEVAAITSEERKRVYVGLYQFHLPKMANMGVIEYDQDRGDVDLAKAGEQLYREFSSDEQPGWTDQRVCLTIGLVGAGTVVLSILVKAWLVSTGLLAVQTVLSVLLFWYGPFG